MRLSVWVRRQQQYSTFAPASIPGACGLVASAAIVGAAVGELLVAQRPSPMGVVSFDDWCEDVPSTRTDSREGHAYPIDVHSSVDLDAAMDSGEPERADVLRLGRPRPVNQAVKAVGQALNFFPGCLVATARESAGGCVIGTRQGECGIAVPTGCQRRALTALEFSVLASCLHTVLVLERSWTAISSVTITALPVTSQSGKGGTAWLPVTLTSLVDPGMVCVIA